MQTYETWHPEAGIDAPCAGVDIAESDGKLTLTLRFSNMVNARLPDLEISFGRVVAMASYEESAHPWNDTQELQPKLVNEWKGYTFPCLIIRESAWVAGFGEGRLFGREGITHYQVVSLDKTVDILATTKPQARWRSN